MRDKKDMVSIEKKKKDLITNKYNYERSKYLIEPFVYRKSFLSHRE